jgi:hypothetical protein
LAAIGSQAEAVLDCIEDEQDSGRPKPIDIEFLLADVIPSVLSLTGIVFLYPYLVRTLITVIDAQPLEFPFLQGRGFVFASQYTKLLPLQLAGQYLDAAVQVIEATEAGIPIKISAVKAVHK